MPGSPVCMWLNGQIRSDPLRIRVAGPAHLLKCRIFSRVATLRVNLARNMLSHVYPPATGA